MEDNPLPTKAQLQKLLGMLLFADDEDEVAVAIIMERAGVDRERFLQRIETKLTNNAAELREQGKEVPQALVDVIEVLEPVAEPDEAVSRGPEEVVDALLRGEVLGSTHEINEGHQVQAFRPNEMDYLTEEDLQILDQISKDLLAQAEDEE